jgi:hypothetical protein
MPTFDVRVRCVVIKSVICEDCTEEQAWESPFDHAVDEIEIYQSDWDVLDIKDVTG